MAEVPTSPIEEIKADIAEAVTEIEAHVDEAEKHEELGLSDADVTKVADKVYDKVKKLFTELLDAVEDAAEIAADAIEAPAAEVEETAPAEEATEETPAEEDVRPKHTHRLFRKVGKKDE
jgi:hypothetical protein